MKILIVLFCMIPCVLSAAAENIKYVQAMGGLNIRSKADPSAAVLATVPYAGSVALLEITGPAFTSGGVDGRWVRVRYGKTEGFAFDGFLSAFPAPSLTDSDLSLEKYARTYLVKSGSQIDPLFIPGVIFSNSRTEVSYSSYLQVPVKRPAEAFFLARNIAAAMNWWFSARDEYPLKSRTYKEMTSGEDENYELTVEVTVKKSNGTVKEILIRKESDGYIRILAVRMKEDGAVIEMTSLD